jgi:hypothetical protein
LQWITLFYPDFKWKCKGSSQVKCSFEGQMGQTTGIWIYQLPLFSVHESSLSSNKNSTLDIIYFLEKAVSNLLQNCCKCTAYYQSIDWKEISVEDWKAGLE